MNKRLTSLALLGALISFSCIEISANPTSLETATPVSTSTPYEDQIRRMSLLLQAVADPACTTDDPNKLQLEYQPEPYIITYAVEGLCSTGYIPENQTMTITCYAPQIRTDEDLSSILFHEHLHTCGAAGVEANEIEPVQLILELFDEQHINFTSGTRIYRTIANQLNQSPDINLTLQRIIKHSDGKEIIVEETQNNFEEIIVNYMLTAYLDSKYGENSDFVNNKLKSSLYSQSSYALRYIMDASGVTMSEMLQYKRKADAVSFVKKIDEGFTNLGLAENMEINQDERLRKKYEIYFLNELAE